MFVKKGDKDSTDRGCKKWEFIKFVNVKLKCRGKE